MSEAPSAPGGPTAYCRRCARSGVGVCDDYPNCPAGRAEGKSSTQMPGERANDLAWQRLHDWRKNESSVTPNPIHTDPNVMHIDVRFYFPIDGESPEGLLDWLSQVIQNSPDLAEAGLISAYQLINDGFSNLLPDSKPLA